MDYTIYDSLPSTKGVTCGLDYFHNMVSYLLILPICEYYIDCYCLYIDKTKQSKVFYLQKHFFQNLLQYYFNSKKSSHKYFKIKSKH